MKYYLSGPMRGIAEYNFPAFNTAADSLRGKGKSVVNPAELSSVGTPRHECMKRDISALLDCDAIVMLPGWQDSAGALLELQVAKECGFMTFTLRGDKIMALHYGIELSARADVKAQLLDLLIEITKNGNWVVDKTIDGWVAYGETVLPTVKDLGDARVKWGEVFACSGSTEKSLCG